jgi:hypothetical protein
MIVLFVVSALTTGLFAAEELSASTRQPAAVFSVSPRQAMAARLGCPLFFHPTPALPSLGQRVQKCIRMRLTITKQ